MRRKSGMLERTPEAAYYDRNEREKSLKQEQKRPISCETTQDGLCKNMCLQNVRDDVTLGHLHGNVLRSGVQNLTVLQRLKWCKVNRLISDSAWDDNKLTWNTERAISGRWQNSALYCTRFKCQVTAMKAMNLNYTDDWPWRKSMVTYKWCMDATAPQERAKQRHYWKWKTHVRPEREITTTMSPTVLTSA